MDTQNVPTEFISPTEFVSPTEFIPASENFEPENENNGAFYHRGAKAFPQSQISENGKTEQLLQYLFHYFGGDYLKGILSRDELVAKYDNGLTTILEQALSKGEDIPF